MLMTKAHTYLAQLINIEKTFDIMSFSCSIVVIESAMLHAVIYIK